MSNESEAKPSKQAALTLRELFQPEMFTNLRGPLSIALEHCLADFENIKARLEPKSADGTLLVATVYEKTIEYVTSNILAYLMTELRKDTHTNCLEPLTIATPSENHFVNVGITALHSLLTYHNASHVISAIMLKKLDEATLSDAAKVAEAIDSCCDCVKTFLAVLNERFPEMFQAPTVS